VWELVRRHHLEPDEANLRVPKNVITRSLGPDPSVEVDIEGPLAVEPNDVYLLCSDGLSGLVADAELGAIAGNFHPKEAVRYLVQLANLRGGHDNITVVIVRIGAWIEPDSAQDVPTQTTADVNGRAPSGLKSKLASLFRSKSRAQAPEPVEERVYRSAECPVNEVFVEKLAELTRKVQAAAVEQAWSLDWTTLTTYRRKEAQARAAGNLRGALKYLSEIIELLGKAARFHRKAGGPASVT
jgi:protein phosphatase